MDPNQDQNTPTEPQNQEPPEIVNPVTGMPEPQPDESAQNPVEPGVTPAPQTPVEPNTTPAPQTPDPQPDESTQNQPPDVTPPPEDPNVTPAYLKGADAAPPPGQSMYPPGSYQAAPGEVVQPSVAGGAVVKGVEDFQADQASRGSLPPQQVGQPTVVPPPNPDANTPQPTPPQASVIPQQPLPPDNSAQSSTSTRLSGLFAGLNRKVLIIIVAGILLPLLIGLAFVLINGNTEQTGTNQDDQLKSDLALIRTGLENYATDNKGAYPALEPTKMDELAEKYLPTNFLDPRTGAPYVLSTSAPVEDEVQYVLGSTCSEDNSLVITSKLTDFSLRVALSDSTYCIDNK